MTDPFFVSDEEATGVTTRGIIERKLVRDGRRFVVIIPFEVYVRGDDVTEADELEIDLGPVAPMMPSVSVNSPPPPQQSGWQQSYRWAPCPQSPTA